MWSYGELNIGPPWPPRSATTLNYELTLHSEDMYVQCYLSTIYQGQGIIRKKYFFTECLEN